MRQSKIGLALGAGAAKGWAHIGIINALKKMGIQIDVVAGCSVGSLVGAAYASDHLNAMDRWVRPVLWNNVDIDSSIRKPIKT